MGTQDNLPEQIKNIIENDPLFFGTTSSPMSIKDALETTGHQDIVKLEAIDNMLKKQEHFLKDYIEKHVHRPVRQVNRFQMFRDIL